MKRQSPAAAGPVSVRRTRMGARLSTTADATSTASGRRAERRGDIMADQALALDGTDCRSSAARRDWGAAISPGSGPRPAGGPRRRGWSRRARRRRSRGAGRCSAAMGRTATPGPSARPAVHRHARQEGDAQARSRPSAPGSAGRWRRRRRRRAGGSSRQAASAWSRRQWPSSSRIRSSASSASARGSRPAASGMVGGGGGQELVVADAGVVEPATS